MGLYHYCMFVYEARGKNLLEDFVTYRYHDLHPGCGRRVQKLRADEVFRVPRLQGANLPVVPEKLEDTTAEEDARQRRVTAEKAAMMKMVLFMHLRISKIRAERTSRKQPRMLKET